MATEMRTLRKTNRLADTPATALANLPAPEMGAEFANRLRDPFEQTYMGVLRTNDPLLIERGAGGVELYRDLKRDGKVFSGLQKRQLALIGKPFQVEPIGKASAKGSADALTVTEILKGFSFDQLCSDLLEALLAGHTVAEIVWTLRDGLVVPARAPKRAQRRFVFVQEDANNPPQLQLLTRENMLTGVPVPERKFIVHRVNPEDDNPYGTGLGLQLWWPVYFKRKGVVAWNKLNDRFGSPTPHGKYPRNASPKEKNTLVDALRAMSNDGYLATPEGMEIALLESKLSGNVTTQEQLVRYMDEWIAEVLTGQEPAGKGGGALAASAIERQNVRQDLTQADSDLLSETLNATLIQWICEFNGFEPCQVYRQVKEEEDLKATAETDKLIHEMGYELDADTLRAKYGEGWTKRAVVVNSASVAGLAGAAAPAAASPAESSAESPASFAEAPNPRAASGDAMDDLVAQELADWQPLVEPLTQPLQRFLEAAAAQGLSAAEVMERLPAMLAEMDSSALTDSLTRTAFAAAAGGEAGWNEAGQA
jgi:phage gp29-like protein